MGLVDVSSVAVCVDPLAFYNPDVAKRSSPSFARFQGSLVIDLSKEPENGGFVSDCAEDFLRNAGKELDSVNDWISSRFQVVNGFFRLAGEEFDALRINNADFPEETGVEGCRFALVGNDHVELVYLSWIGGKFGIGILHLSLVPRIKEGHVRRDLSNEDACSFLVDCYVDLTLHQVSLLANI